MSFVLCDGKIVDERFYPSEDLESVVTTTYFNTIDKLIRPDEEKVLTWTGYLFTKEIAGRCHYRSAAFVLTHERLYVATNDLIQTNITISYMPSCESYCLFNKDYGYLPSFVLNFNNVIEFMYKENSSVEYRLQKELRAMKIKEV